MATTSIWAIKGNATAIRRVEMYIVNPEKTAEWKEQLREVPPLYQPFQEGEDLYLYDNRKNGL